MPSGLQRLEQHFAIIGYLRTDRIAAVRLELERLQGKLTVRGYTLVPLRVYFKNGWAKVELGLAKGKDVGDRREDLKRKTAMEEARRAMGSGRRR